MVTVKEFRRAVQHVDRCNTAICCVSDDDFLKCDLKRDLFMGNIRFANIIITLNRIKNIDLPMDVFKSAKDGTAKSLLDAVNSYLKKA